MKPCTYISGPMTGLPALNFPAFHKAAASLRASGHNVINPAELNPDPSSPREHCMRVDLAALLLCDSIALIAGWENSRGARLERLVAIECGMREIFLTLEG